MKSGDVVVLSEDTEPSSQKNLFPETTKLPKLAQHDEQSHIYTTSEHKDKLEIPNTNTVAKNNISLERVMENWTVNKIPNPLPPISLTLYYTEEKLNEVDLDLNDVQQSKSTDNMVIEDMDVADLKEISKNSKLDLVGNNTSLIKSADEQTEPNRAQYRQTPAKPAFIFPEFM